MASLTQTQGLATGGGPGGGSRVVPTQSVSGGGGGGGSGTACPACTSGGGGGSGSGTARPSVLKITDLKILLSLQFVLVSRLIHNKCDTGDKG